VPKLPVFPYRKQILVAAIATWTTLLWMLLVIPPTFFADVLWRNSFLPLLLLIGLAVGLTLWAITGRWKRAGLWASIITVAAWLRINQLDTLINIGLLLAFGVVWEYYWRYQRPSSLIN
jgi:hypothetical protein